MRTRQVPPLLANIVHTALQVCEEVGFSAGKTCPYCGGTLSGYDARKRRFALLRDDDLPHPVYVTVHRSYCRNCKKIAVPQVPFYPGTRIGSPVVDLCRCLSATMPFSQVSTCLGLMGVEVDRWSVRHFSRMPLQDVPSIEVFGMRIPLSVISLSTLAGSANETGGLTMDDVLIACNYPSGPEVSRIQPARVREDGDPEH